MSRVGNGNGRLGLAILATLFFHLLDDVETFHNLAEDNMLAVQPAGLDGADKELGAVGVGAGVSHGESAGVDVLQAEVFVLELVAVDRLATSAVAGGEVTTWEQLNKLK